MPTSGDDAATETADDTDATTGAVDSDDAATGPVDGDDTAAGTVSGEDAETALAAAIDDADGTPTCALCSKPADYFLYEAGHVEKFVCWEHVSPHSAAVDGEDARPGRPRALSL